MPYKDNNKRKEVNALSRQNRTKNQRKEILSLLGNKCKCGFSDPRALAIDHINGGGTTERKTIGGGYYSYLLKKIKSGSQDYQILCFNCNQIKKVENKEQIVKWTGDGSSLVS